MCKYKCKYKHKCKYKSVPSSPILLIAFVEASRCCARADATCAAGSICRASGCASLGLSPSLVLLATLASMAPQSSALTKEPE